MFTIRSDFFVGLPQGLFLLLFNLIGQFPHCSALRFVILL